MEFVFVDEYRMRDLIPKKRLAKITEILKKGEETDESVRWDCVWLAGEMLGTVSTPVFRKEIADLMVWILNNDGNSIVRHEAAFQIGLHNMRAKIPDLINSILNDNSDLVKHEAIEAIGLLRDHGSKETLVKMQEHESAAVSETASFVLKRLERLKDRGSYRGEGIL